MEKKGGKLVLMRHGESVWNQKNLFTGWVDVALSLEGINQSLQAGKQLQPFSFNRVYTSNLSRAIHTASLALATGSLNKTPYFLPDNEQVKKEWFSIHSTKTIEEMVPIEKTSALNERMYGTLQGMNKDQMRTLHGEEQVQLWRRSYKAIPPGGESLEMTRERVISYFKTSIEPKLRQQQTILVVAHGNSIRSIIMELEGLAEDDVFDLEIPFATPLFYQIQGVGYEKHPL